MADILIRGVSMPPSCAVCRWNCNMLLSGDLNGFAEGAYTRHEACPLIALPEGHGRLVDADALEADTEWDAYDDGFISYSQMAINNAATIVPADKEDT